MEFVDTHCHPQFDNFLPDSDKLVTEARKEGVAKLIAVGTTIADSQKAIDYASKHDCVWASVGVHPHEAAELADDKSLENILAKLLVEPKVVAVGEIGLDFYKNYSPKEDQIAVFRRLFETGLEAGMPFIFHVREAFDDFWKMFDSYNSRVRPIRGVIHSFSSNVKELESILERDLFVGLNGIMTFTKDQNQLEAAKSVPKNRLLLETDAPFLSPKPFRGQTCEPKFVIETARFLAELREERLEDLAEYTTKNANQLFGLNLTK